MSKLLFIGVIVIFSLVSGSLSEKCGNIDCGASSCCLDQLHGAQCYSPSQYSCVASGNSYKLCPAGDGACGTAPNQYCYDTTQYYCINGALMQHGTGTSAPPTHAATAPPATTKPATAPPATTKPATTAPTSNTCGGVNCGSQQCCLGSNNAGMCYSPDQYTCGGGMLCPKGQVACGHACYDPSMYHCTGGQLQQGADSGACPYATNIAGPTCAPGQCCGAGTMSPSCLTDATKQCCVHYLASTQCNLTESCCGSLGSGASSSAFCCAESTSCCAASIFGINTCCKATDVCCGENGLQSWCCPQGSACGTVDAQCAAPAPATTTAAPAACPNIATSIQGPICNAGECCGADTMSPSCLTDPNKQCCTHFLASTQCNLTESCCGSLGSGASSSAFCCAESTVCCDASGFGVNTCCKSTDVCCGANAQLSWCCPQGSACGTINAQCGAAASTASPTPATESCPNASENVPGVTCNTGECCGAYTMSPSCLTDPTKQCCEWYAASTQCNVTQSCCGSLGSGASSSAFCCSAETTCCSNGLAENLCCADSDVCCGIWDQFSWCCPKGSTCGTSFQQCGASS